MNGLGHMREHDEHTEGLTESIKKLYESRKR